MKTPSMAAQIAALPKLPLADLVARYTEVFGAEPAIKRTSWLWRRIAWRLQVDKHGGLSDEAAERLKALVAKLPAAPPKGDRTSAATRPAAGIRPSQSLTVGSILERAYKGTTVRVKVIDDGFEHDGVTYGSLTAVAQAITGSKSINGRLWFGLTKRSRDR